MYKLCLIDLNSGYSKLTTLCLLQTVQNQPPLHSTPIIAFLCPHNYSLLAFELSGSSEYTELCYTLHSLAAFCPAQICWGNVVHWKVNIIGIETKAQAKNYLARVVLKLVCDNKWNASEHRWSSK